MGKLVVIIAGPTATGKTTLAVDIAREFSCPVISADSRQCYRQLNIGTAKPSPSEMKGVNHFFIDSHNLDEDFNAGKFSEDARGVINRFFLEKDIIVVAGGSGLYIDALLFGMDELPPTDPELRKELDDLYHESGIDALRRQLKELDPVHFEVVDLDNPQRIARAIEVSRLAGRPYSELIHRSERQAPWPYIMCGIEYERDELYERINERTEKMFRDGLVEEVRSLIPHRDMNALQTVGYREVFMHIDGMISEDEAKSLVSQHTRNFAKRQLTWLKRYPEMTWFRQNEKEKMTSWIRQSAGLPS